MAFQYSTIPAVLKGAPGQPIASIADNHLEGIGFFDTIAERDAHPGGLRTSNFIAFVDTDIYAFTGPDFTPINADNTMSDSPWTATGNWTLLNDSSSTGTIEIADVNGLIAALAAKSDVGHNHDADYADITHTHNADDVDHTRGAATHDVGYWIDNIYTSIASIESTNNAQTVSIALNSSGISTNTALITANSSQISTLQTSDGSQNFNIAVNTAATAANAGSISTNATGISTNAAAISTNSSDITAVEGDVATNTADISTNTSAIATNVSDISTNASGISTNATNISTNTANIATNTSAISTNASGISTNSGDIATNATGIATNAGTIATVSGTATAAASTAAAASGMAATNLAAIGQGAGNSDLGTFAGSTITDSSTVKTALQELESAVELAAGGGASELGDLTDVDLSGITTGDLLQYDGTDFVRKPSTDFATESDLTAAEGLISGNTSAISTNTGAISTNASGISTNVGAISTNTSGISTNASGISTNASAISTNATSISTNAGAISTNSTSISTNASDIATNASDIATNASDISTNATGISTNTSGVSTNATGVSTNASAIAVNTSAISTNASGISTNSSGVSTNASDISALQSDVSTNTTAISTNATGVSTNASAISTNSSAIAGKANTVHTHVKADITDFSDSDYVPEISPLTNTLSWGTTPGDIETNMGDGYLVYWDQTNSVYKRAPIFSMWQSLAAMVANENPDFWDTQLGSSSNPADLDGDGVVGIGDILQVLASYGAQGGEFIKSSWRIGVLLPTISTPIYSDANCQNPSATLHTNNGYTEDTWETFDIDMQDSGATAGESTATLERTTGSPSTIVDTANNEYVGFKSNSALAANYTFPGKADMKLQLTRASQGIARAKWTGPDNITTRILIKAYDSAGTQLTFQDGDPYEFVFDSTTSTNTAGNSYLDTSFGQILDIPLEANDDLDEIRIFTQAKSEFGKVDHLTFRYTVNLLQS